MTRLKPYPKYKDSGIEWIGEVPEGWRSTEVRWTFQRAKLTNCPTETLLSVYRDYGVIPKDSRNDNWNRESEDLSAYQLVCEGDLVTNKMKAWQGSIAVSSYRGIVSPAYYVYKSMHNERNEYFHYLLRSKPYILHYGIISKGIRINQWDLEHEAFRLTPILLPSKNEQQAIAVYLDRETEQIDALITKKARSIELLREKRQAMITHAVTKGLNPNAKMKDSGSEWIGDVPEGWNVCKLNLFGRLKGGFAFKATDFTYEGIPVVRMNNLKRGTLDFSNAAFVPQSVAPQEFCLNTGDILWGMSGSIGETGSLGNFARVREDDLPALLNQRVGKFVLNQKRLNSFFWEYYIQTNAFYEQIIIFSTGTAQFNVSSEQVESCSISLPPLSEQQVITAYLDDRCTVIDTLITKTERSIELLKEKRQALITAAVTGKIDVREAAPEAVCY